MFSSRSGTLRSGAKPWGVSRRPQDLLAIGCFQGVVVSTHALNALRRDGFRLDTLQQWELPVVVHSGG